MTVQPIPESYHSVTLHLNIKGTMRVLDSYKQAFGATKLVRMGGPNDTVAHAEIRIGDPPIMVSDETLDTVYASPDTLQSMSVGLMVYVPSVDAVFVNTPKMGGMEVHPVVDQSYDDRSDTSKDPFGRVRTVSTHAEDVAPDEMARRVEKWMGKQAAASA